MKMKRWILHIAATVAALMTAPSALAVDLGIRTNLLYLATASPNIGLDWAANRHFSFSLLAGYNPFSFPSYLDSEGSTVNPKMQHWLLNAESRYWFCEPMSGWSVGVHAFGAQYNLSPLKWMDFMHGHRYRGWCVGGGITVGYQIPLAAHWGLDLSLGAGYIYTRYTQYPCYTCSDRSGEYRRHYIGPTKVATSLIYYF